MEWAEGIIGDQYPTPDRILKHTEILIRDYLRLEMGGEPESTEVYDLFATEGGTAGMCYAFDSLQENFLIDKGTRWLSWCLSSLLILRFRNGAILI